jgi:hypothetical protein
MRGTVTFERLNCGGELYLRLLLNDAVYRESSPFFPSPLLSPIRRHHILTRHSGAIVQVRPRLILPSPTIQRRSFSKQVGGSRQFRRVLRDPEGYAYDLAEWGCYVLH